jgi:hypothetical protein
VNDDEDDDDDETTCPACGEEEADVCNCIDCGAELCVDCAVGGRCDSCDCDFLADSGDDE